MTKFNQTGVLEVPQDIHAKACSVMASFAVSEEHTLATIKRYKEDSDYILCPHSAVGVYALEQKWRELISGHKPSHPICFASLATASPAKFADAQQKALGYVCPLPVELERIMALPSRCQKIDNDGTALKALMEEALKEGSARGLCGEGRLLGQRIKARVPGSCANLGSGFDVFGIAVGLYLTTQVEVSERKDDEPKLSITFEGEGQGSVPLDETNFLWTSVVHVVQKEGKAIPPNVRFSLLIKNDIPLGRGLGSSGAAVVSGVLIADKLFDLGLSASQMLRYCVEIEGHPDNASASLSGGFVVCCGFEDDSDEKSGGVPTVYARRLPYSAKIRAVVAIPDFEVSTEKARQALPPTYPRAEVVFNLQRVGLMAAALTDDGLDEPSLVREAMKDKIHQPFRMHLVPGLQECLALSPQNTPGLLGVCLSGSGSTILALCRDNFGRVEERMREVLHKAGVRCRTATLDIDQRGSLVTDL